MGPTKPGDQPSRGTNQAGGTNQAARVQGRRDNKPTPNFEDFWGRKPQGNTRHDELSHMDRSDGEKVDFFFRHFPGQTGGRAAARHGGRTPHKLPIFRPSPGRNHRPFHARTQLRTHARTAPQPKPKSISRFGYTPQPPTYRTSLKADKEVGGCFWGFSFNGVHVEQTSWGISKAPLRHL